ncbi:hypothetical protein GC177_07120 [bacterium]|nr:hypothetical protein [bacterium]
MFKVTIGSVVQLTPGVWRAMVEKQDLAILGDSKAPKADVAVVLLGRADYDKRSRTLSFPVKNVQFLARGKGMDVVFIQSKLYTLDKTTKSEVIAEPKRKPGRPAGSKAKAGKKASVTKIPAKRGRKRMSRAAEVIGDEHYTKLLEGAGSEVQQLGKKLLNQVRAAYNAPLKQQPTDQYRFSQTGDNFWSVRIQKRDKSLLVTLRGTAETLGSTSLKLEKDRPGFSKVKLTNAKEVDEAAKLLVKVAEKAQKPVAAKKSA